MSSGAFVSVLQRFAATVAPWFVRNKHIGTFVESVAMVKAESIETLGQGLRMSQPLRGDASALPYLSRDRRIRIYDTEPEASKRYRLSQWRQLKRQFGTHQGELRNLAPFFLPAKPFLRIVHQDGNGDRATWHQLNSAGVYSVFKKEPSNWDWDGQTEKWSRFWLIIVRQGSGDFFADLPAEWDDGWEWDDGTLWGGSPAAAQIADMVEAVRSEAKAAHSSLWGVLLIGQATDILPTANATTDPDGWTTHPVGNWSTVLDPDTGLPTRPPYVTVLWDKNWS